MKVPATLVFGVILSAFFVLVALLSFVWTPHDVAALNIADKMQAPSATYWLGTDHFGRDTLSMLMVGARTSEIIMRGNDLVFAFPSLVIAILITAVFGPSAVNAILAIGIFNIPVFARVTRGGALSLWTLDYILAARVAGKGRLRISAEHILPNILNLLIVQGTIQFSLGILAEAALSYIGLGAQLPTPSWGRMLSEAQTMIYTAPRLALWPGLAIVAMVLGLNLMGDGLRDLTDPRLRRGRA